MTAGQFSVPFVAAATDGVVIPGTCGCSHEVICRRVVTDSRDAVEGALFVALSGDRFDGHDFVRQVVENGATAVMVSVKVPGLFVPQIIVRDTTLALGRLAAAHRDRFDLPLAAVTGSSGKTTTRNLLANLLAEHGKVLQPRKNFNNHIGVPLTLLALNASHRCGVLELGCSGFNEIDYLTGLVRPDVGLVTNVGPAHLEQLKDLEGVARAKGELFLNMPSRSTAVVNIDDQRVAAMSRVSSRCVTFGLNDRADVRLVKRYPHARGQRLEVSVMGHLCTVAFGLPGLYNAIDAIAALAAAVEMGVPVEAACRRLSTVEAVPGRLRLIQQGHMTILDDAYNANPASMRSSLDVLCELAEPQHRYAVLGDMLELGESTETSHRELGRAVAVNKVNSLIVYGRCGEWVCQGARDGGMDDRQMWWAKSHEEILGKLADFFKNPGVLLIKGSRGMNLDRVVRDLQEG